MNPAAWSLAWMRCAGFLAAFPQALGMGIPITVRALAGAALALALAAVARAPHAVTMGGALGELVVGLGLGFCLRLPLMAVEAAGQAVGFTTNAANFLAQNLPSDSGGTGGNLWSSAYLWLGLLVYFSVGGPQAMVEALAGSMRIAPLGRALPPAGLAPADLAALAARMAAFTIALCLPPVLASLAAQWGLGLVFRASARMQMVSYSLPLATLAAVGVLALALPTWPALLAHATGWSLEAASGFSAASGGHP